MSKMPFVLFPEVVHARFGERSWDTCWLERHLGESTPLTDNAREIGRTMYVRSRIWARADPRYSSTEHDHPQFDSETVQGHAQLVRHWVAPFGRPGERRRRSRRRRGGRCGHGAGRSWRCSGAVCRSVPSRGTARLTADDVDGLPVDIDEAPVRAGRRAMLRFEDGG